MSFWTSVVLYYPLTDQPHVSVSDLAEFAQRFLECGAVQHSTAVDTVEFTPGRSIDLDLAESDGWEDPTERYPDGRLCEHPESVGVFKRGSKIPIAERFETLKQMSQPIYRAFMTLGNLTEDLNNRLHIPSSDNEQAFAPVACSIEAGPVCVGNEDIVDAAGVASLFALSISGPGYCYPRSHREVVEHFKQQPEIQLAADLVRETWPIEPSKPPAFIVAQRKQLGEAFMGSDPDEPLDWCWGIQGI